MYSFAVSTEQSLKLAEIRVELDHLFKNSTIRAYDAWKRVVEEFNNPNVTHDAAKKRWDNMCAKARKWKRINVPTGAGNEEQCRTRAPLEYIEVILAFLDNKHSYNPAIVIDTGATQVEHENTRMSTVSSEKNTENSISGEVSDGPGSIDGTERRKKRKKIAKKESCDCTDDAIETLKMIGVQSKAVAESIHSLVGIIREIKDSST